MTKPLKDIISETNDIASRHSEYSDLTVITVAAHDRDSGLLHYMIRSVFKFTDLPPRIIISDNGHNGPLAEMYDDNKYISVVKNAELHKNASMSHGSGLNKAFALVETDRTAIIESDCVVLNKGWDDTADCLMSGAVKTQFLDKFGFRAYFPLFLVFSTSAMKKDGDIDFMPESGGKSKVGRDTGWQIYKKVSEEEVSPLEVVKCTDEKCMYFDRKFVPNALELWKDGIPIVAHVGRGSKVLRRGPHIFKMWKPILEKILR